MISPNKDSSKYKGGIVNLFFCEILKIYPFYFIISALPYALNVLPSPHAFKRSKGMSCFVQLACMTVLLLANWTKQIDMTLWSKSNWISGTISAGIVYEFLLLNSSESEHFQRGFLPGISQLKDFLLLCKLNHLQSLSFQIFGKLTMNW